MKVRYSQFMENYGDKMDNFYPDWEVNAVKGLLQTGRFSYYTDHILDQLLIDTTFCGSMQPSDPTFKISGNLIFSKDD